MGYTHYWSVSKQTTLDNIVEFVQTVLDDYNSVISGGVCNSHEIRFNGKPDPHEDFVIRPQDENSWRFCKTDMKPYDEPVSIILLILAYQIPEFSFTSDGFSADDSDPDYTPYCEDAWKTAAETAASKYGVPREFSMSILGVDSLEV